MPVERSNRIFTHPIHQEGFADLVQLISELRQCRNYQDYYFFQQTLLEKILEVQRHRSQCARIARRLRSGRRMTSDDALLRSGDDTGDPESWELEADVCERVDRQLRSVGDALAWQVFSYDRAVIVALSRNDPPGPMTGKAGLAAERDFVAQWSDDEHAFVLLHDLTSCLHIGDATLFKSVGQEYEAYLYEIKTDPGRRRPAQLRRQRLAEEAIRDGGPLPGDPAARLVKLDIPYKTHLKILRDAFDRAASKGVLGVKVPGGRAMVVADLRRGYGLWLEQEFLERTGSAHRQALKRAGIRDTDHTVFYGSDDLTARSPIQPPWAIYPMSPIACANLIVDMGIYIVTVADQPLLAALRGAGLKAEWVLPRSQKELRPGQVILRAYLGSRGVEMRPPELQRLALELADLPTWVAGVKELLARDGITARPWPYFADEGRIWA